MSDAAEARGEDAPPAIELRGICKDFGAVKANSDVSLTVQAGTIHGIVGENGAGKSTLMSILYGFYEADAGEIFIGGKKVTIADSSDAIRHGIGMVHQHFMLIPVFSVLDNVILGAEGGMVLSAGRAEARRRLEELEHAYGLEVDPDTLIEALPVGHQQRVEILKALYRDARILILDEPTGVLTPQEADRLFEILRELRRQGETVILITHKLREIMDATDNVTVMRAGKVVANRRTSETSTGDLAELMVGRKVLFEVDKQEQEPGEIVLEAHGLAVAGHAGVRAVSDASFTVRAGEIVGVAGVSGNGQSELMDALAGIVPPLEGQFTVAGRAVSAAKPADPAQLRAIGVAHVPEDRHAEGLVMNFPAEDSLLLGHHRKDSYCAAGGLLLDRAAVRDNAESVMPRFDVRPVDPQLRSALFSGGNQQKLVLSREITAQPKLFLVGQPTRGVDIGAIEAIHRRLLEMRAAGCAILLFSFELDEVMSLADRILVMNSGRIVGEVAASAADERSLGLMMAGVEAGQQQ